MKLYVLDIQSVEGISDSNNAVTYEILKANAKALFEIIKKKLNGTLLRGYNILLRKSIEASRSRKD